MVINGKRWKDLFKREMCCQNLMLQNIKGFQVWDDSDKEWIEKKKNRSYSILYYEVQFAILRSYKKLLNNILSSYSLCVFYFIFKFIISTKNF